MATALLEALALPGWVFTLLVLPLGGDQLAVSLTGRHHATGRWVDQHRTCTPADLDATLQLLGEATLLDARS